MILSLTKAYMYDFVNDIEQFNSYNERCFAFGMWRFCYFFKFVINQVFRK